MGISTILSHKQKIDERLTSWLHNQKLHHINTYEATLIDRLLPFVTSGKTIRGCLVIFGFSLFNTQTPSAIFDIAAALELFHSGFLIHDDIMDRDDLRRGKPSIHAQYTPDTHDGESIHFGASMGINAGDYCFFSGYKLLTGTQGLQSTAVHMVSQEFSRVTAAQMADVEASYSKNELTEDEILSIYLYKTARYTFSLPLCVGAELAHASESAIRALEQYGEAVGTLFQIRDDELNLFGVSTKTGKSIGGDRKEHKQTLMYHFLQKEYPATRFAELTDTEAIDLYTSSKSKERIEAKKTQLLRTAHSLCEQLKVSDEKKFELRALAEFVQKREN